jgi:hypothetical protein
MEVCEMISNIVTIKLIQQKGHKGPKSASVAAGVDRSKAASKLLFDANAKIMVADRVDRKVTLSQNKTSRSYTMEVPEGIDPVNFAFNVIEVFEGLSDSESYTRRSAAYDSRQTQVYNSLGFQYDGSSSPTLSRDQRKLYNKEMFTQSFDYVDIHINVRVEGKKTIQTHHVRLMKYMADDAVNAIAEKAKSRCSKTRVVDRLAVGKSVATTVNN